MEVILNSVRDKLLEVYINNNLTKFNVGKLVDEDEAWIILESYDSYGLYDGFILYRKDIIRRINYETQYLLSLNLEEHNNRSEFFWKKEKKDSLLEKVLKTVKKEKIVSFFTEAEDVIYGSIEKVEEDCLYVKGYTNNGKADGYTIIEKEIIESIQVDARECICMEKNLLKNRSYNEE